MRKLGLGIALIAIGIMVAPEVSAQEMTPITTLIPARTWIIEPNGDVPNLADLVAAAGGTLHRVHNEINIAVALSDDPDFGTRLEAANKIRSVTRDARVPWGPQGPPWGVRVMELPDSGIEANPMGAYFFPCQWNMMQIDAPGAWSQGEFGNPGVKVAVLDTGVDPDHLDLAGHIDTAQSVSMLTPGSGCNAYDEASFRDLHWHGSFVSGLIAGNGLGMAAVAPDATIVGVKVLACDNFGSFADIIAGILYAASLPDVDVINMSIQGGFPKSLGIGTLVGAFNLAVNYAMDQGKLVVSAAGNYAVNMDKDRDFHWVPAQAGSGIAVWAGDIDGNLASYSNFGRTGTWVGAGGGDVFGGAAIPLPGCAIPWFLQDGIVSVCSTTSIVHPICQTSNDYYLLGATGTSYACPLVSGVAALVDGKNGGALGAGDLKTILSNTADDIGKSGVDALFSHGRVNANEAVK